MNLVFEEGMKSYSQKNILTFVFLESENTDLSINAYGNVSANTIYVTVYNGTIISNLTPDITISPGTTISPDDGVAQNFSTGPVAYTVTGEDGTTKTYNVIVDISQYGDKDIISYNFLVSENLNLTYNAIGNVGATTVDLIVPDGTNISNLTPKIEVSPGSIIDPDDGVPQDFTGGPITYNVTAQDSSIKTYSVYVNYPPVLPVTYNFSGRTMTTDEVYLNGSATTDIRVAPGSSVNLRVVGDLVDSNTICPTCVVQIYVRLNGVFSLCLCDWTTENANFDGSTTFTAPSVPGTYFINPTYTLNYSCQPGTGVSTRFSSSTMAVVFVE